MNLERLLPVVGVVLAVAYLYLWVIDSMTAQAILERLHFK